MPTSVSCSVQRVPVLLHAQVSISKARRPAVFQRNVNTFLKIQKDMSAASILLVLPFPIIYKEPCSLCKSEASNIPYLL